MNVRRESVVVLVVVLLAWPLMGATPATSVRLEPVGDGDAGLPFALPADLAEREAAMVRWLVERHPELDPDDPGVRSLAWSWARWSGVDDGRPVIRGKYHDFGVGNFNNYQQLAAAVDALPGDRAFRDAVLAEYAELMIELRVPVSVADAVKRLGSWPAGEVVSVDSAAGLHRAFEARYGAAIRALDARDRARLWVVLAAWNPALTGGRFFVAEGEPAVGDAELTVTLPRDDGRTLVLAWRLDPAVPVCLPEFGWLQGQAAKATVPGWGEAPAGAAPSRVLSVELDGALPARAVGEAGWADARLTLRLVERGGLIQNAYVLPPPNPLAPRPVLPAIPAPVEPAVKKVEAPVFEGIAENLDIDPALLEGIAADARAVEQPAAKDGAQKKRPALRRATSDELGHPRPSDWLVLDGGRLTGRCVVPVGRRDAVLTLQLDATVEGVRISGSFRGGIGQGRDVRQVHGAVAGEVLAAEPGPVDGLAPDAAWPRWRGPDSTGATVGEGPDLVTDLADGRLAWVSDMTLPTGRGPDLRGRVVQVPRGTPLAGGSASPVVKDGRVYLWYFQPSGEAAYGDAGDRARQSPDDAFLYRLNLIEADDVVVALDAATGRLLWRRVYERSALNWGGFNKAVPVQTPVAWRDRLFAVGNTGRVYCLDAATGRTLWRSNIGRRHRWMEALRPVLIAEHQMFSSRSDFVSSPVVVDGVLVVNDHTMSKADYRYEQSNGLIGFDAQTGRTLWHLPGVCRSDPVAWTDGGKELLLAFGPDGARCIEPRTGELLWHEPAAAWGRGLGVAIADGVLVCAGPAVQPAEAGGDGDDQKAAGAEPRIPIRGFRIDRKGAELAWELPAPIGNLRNMPVIMEGRAYVQVSAPDRRLLCLDLKTGRVLDSMDDLFVARGGNTSFLIGVGPYLMGKAAGMGWLPVGQKLDPASLRSVQVPMAAGYTGACTPAAADGRLFFRMPDRLVCWDLRAR